jgi:hypothetical protein
VRLVAGIECDLGDRLLCVVQSPCRSLQPEPAGQLEWRLANHAAEHAVKMKRRQARHSCQRLQLQRIVEVKRDVFDRSLNGSCVKGAGVRLHWLRL